jgi:4a-hydroxytetrahydrobiopterin dehydratase
MKKLTTEEINTALASLKGWTINENSIEKKYVFKDFNQAFGFLSRIALYSEKVNHHADWSGVYNKVNIKLSTHDAGVVTQTDIDFAKEIDTYL